MEALPSLHLRGYELLARYSLEADESIIQGIVSAFVSLGVDPGNQGTVIHDVVDTDALRRLQESSDRHVRISMQLWGHAVVVTAEDVSIYGTSEERL